MPVVMFSYRFPAVLRKLTNLSVFTIKSNNAGVMATPFSLSKDGIELQFATNHIGMSSITFSPCYFGSRNQLETFCISIIF